MEILGLLDTLESLILDGFKIPLTKKTIVDEEKLLSIIDKMRLVLQGGGDFAKKAIERGATKLEIEKAKEGGEEELEGKAIEVLSQAYEIAKEVRRGADKYADEVLSNLEATSSRILRAIRAGRVRLAKVTGKESTEEKK